MKLLEYIKIFAILAEISAQNLSKSPTLKAFNEIIYEFYHKNHLKIHIFFKINEDFLGKHDKFYNEIIKEYLQFKPYVLSSINVKFHGEIGVARPAIFFAYSCFSYEVIHRVIILNNHYATQLKFLIYLRNC